VSCGLCAFDLQGKLYLDLFFSGDFSFELSTTSHGRLGFTGGGGAGPFIAGLVCLGDPSRVFPGVVGARVDCWVLGARVEGWVEGARVDCWLVSEQTESGDLHTGSRSDL